MVRRTKKIILMYEDNQFTLLVYGIPCIGLFRSLQVISTSIFFFPVISSGNKSIPDANTPGNTFIELPSHSHIGKLFLFCILFFKKIIFKRDLIK